MCESAGRQSYSRVNAMDDDGIIKEFLIESNENLARFDQEMVELEQRPKDAELLASIFRTIHTIKGTCGFLGFSVLEAITHQAESILSQLRAGERELTQELVSLILDAVDAIKQVLDSIEATGSEGEESYEELRNRLEQAAGMKPGKAADKGDGEQAERTDGDNTADLPARQGEETGECGGIDKPAAGDAPVSERSLTKAAKSSPDENCGSAKATALADSTIRVGVDLLDKLMNLVGELVLTRNQIL